MRRVRVLISGKVQGVGFRWICAQEAKDRGIAGFVRNLPDGRVEAAFEGADGAVAGMRDWAGQGPQWAEVTGIETHEEHPRGDQDFEILG